MLIKLIPDSPNLAVFFALTFANAPFAYSCDKPLPSVPDDISLETALYMSLGWANQLNALAMDDLDSPIALHALDRAAGIPTLLQEVTLDVPSNIIRCLFIDGSVEEWMWPANPQTPVPAEKKPRLPSDPVFVQSYFEMLQGIIRDVSQSAAEENRERQRDSYLLQQQQEEQQRSTEASTPDPRPPVKTHKRQRSFFMNIVASIVNLTPMSSSYSRLPPSLSLKLPPKRSPSTVPLPASPLLTTPPPTPTQIKSVFPTLWSPPNSPIRQTLRQSNLPPSTARTLRWRARSSLVDAFRRFVLPEIVSRSPYGSYRNYHAINVGVCGPDGTGRVGAGYYVWTIESVLRRAGERMDELAQMAVAAGTEASRERDRKTKTKIFPRFSVPRLKVNASNNQVTINIQTRRSVEEDKAERERDKREAEYFATTTQSIQSPHLFSDEEEGATDDGRPKSSLRRSPTANEDGDADSIETETDGSSVHTPSSEHETFLFPPSSSKPGDPNMLPPLPPKPNSGTDQVVPPTPVQEKPPSVALIPECPPPGSLPPTEMAEYKALSRLTGKLQYLLIGARARAAQAENDARQHEVVLEVRSRRKAWLNRALGSCFPSTNAKSESVNGYAPYGYIATCTLSAPSVSSSLAKSVWTAEDWEYSPDVCVEDDDEVFLQEQTRPSANDDNEQVGFGYPLRRMSSERNGRRLEPKLFPVIEEEDEPIPLREDEEILLGKRLREEDDLRELELGVAGLGLDLEGGEMAWMDDGGRECKPNSGVVKVGNELQRPKVRKRTSSMYEQKSPFGRQQNQLFLKTDQRMTSCDPPGLTPSSLLCQPLTTSVSSDNRNFKPKFVFVPPTADNAMICESFVGEIRDSGEFTLSMDLPPPKRVRSTPAAYGNLPAATSTLSILSPSPPSSRQIQFTIVPDAR